MTDTQAAAERIIQGFRESNGYYNDVRNVDEDTLKRRNELFGDQLVASKNFDRAISQLIAAVGTEIEHAFIVNAPTAAQRDYHCAVFGPDLLGYVEFTTTGADPRILVRTVARRSISEIEIRAAQDYRDGRGSSVIVAKYASDISLDIRQRDEQGQNAPVTEAWLNEILNGLRKDLAAS